MRLYTKICLSLLLFICSITPVLADSFVVKNIRVEGLQGISQSTVLNYLPVHTGQTFDTSQSGAVIRKLYDTGLFSDVSLSQDGNTLVVKVMERSVINTVTITGNKTVSKEKLDPILKNIGLVQGRVFDSSVLETLKHSLESEYENIGKYNATVTTTVTPLPRNRVNIKIEISEGRTLQVQGIRIIGNHAFSTRKILNSLPLAKPHIWSFITREDLYSQDKLHDTLKALTNFYMDRGYLKFRIDSIQSALTPDRNNVYIIISITEGPLYTIKGFKIVGNLVLPETKLQQLINIRSGSVYSQSQIDNIKKLITDAYGNMGYAFANVSVVPDVDENTKQVFLTFYIEPGNRVYVRRVNFSGNTKTEDIVLRRAMPQMEGSLSSTAEIAESERQLNLLGYMQNVHSQNVPVPGAPDQVDLNYNVTEAPSAQAMASVGYGTDGLVLGAGINQSNFMGTGRSLGVNFNSSRYERIYSINYNNPYYTPDGIQRGFTLYAQRVTPGSLNITSYSTDMYGGTVNYNIPISAYGDFLLLGYGYQITNLSVGSNNPLLPIGNAGNNSSARQLNNFVNSNPTRSVQLSNFVFKNGTHFNQILLNTGWSHNGLDRAIFPTHGLYQDAGLQFSLPGGSAKSLDYYKTTYDMNFYQPIVPGYIFTGRLSLGYGAGFGETHGLPFIANYYAGGIGYNGAVRGYTSNTLGPSTTYPYPDWMVHESPQPLGGNKLAAGSLGLIFPNPISQDRLRLTAFVDGGNVWSSQAVVRGGASGGPPRYSAGMAADWRVPILNVLLDLSLARGLNVQRGDQLTAFQFNIGTSF